MPTPDVLVLPKTMLKELPVVLFLVLLVVVIVIGVVVAMLNLLLTVPIRLPSLRTAVLPNLVMTPLTPNVTPDPSYKPAHSVSSKWLMNIP